MSNCLRRCCRICLLLWCTLVAGGARADEAKAEFAPQVWINPGIYAAHFDRDKDLRNNNVGFGAEVMLTNDHVLLAGSYANSNWARTHYFGYQWRPLHWQPAGLNVSGGIIVGAFDGYPNYRDGGWFVAPLPVLSIEGDRFGVNLALVPTISNRLDGAIAIQVKLRVW
jgi:hypothetical protein